MNTKHFAILLAIVGSAGLGFVQPSLAQTTVSSTTAASPVSPPPAMVPPVGFSASSAASQATLPALPTSLPSIPTTPPRSPLELASWQIGSATLVIDATPRGQPGAVTNKPETGVGELNLLSLRW